MRKNLRNILIASTCMMVMNSAHAYRFVIYTDDTKSDKAEQIGEMMKTTYPFSKFDIEYEIVTVKSNQLDCGSSRGIDRLITCDNLGELQKKAMMTGGDQAMILKDSENFGGSSHVGGGVPVITTATSTRAMLHEYMHTLGLCDEYEYKASEAEIYCQSERSANPNVVFIEPWDPYASDEAARTRHASQIPWFKDILTTTTITNSEGTKLGTGDVDVSKRAVVNNTTEPMIFGQPTGLYKGKVCNNAFPRPKISWQPGGSPTVMENFNAGLGAPLEKIVEKLMISKGAKKKLEFEDYKVPTEDKSAGSVVVTPQPEPQVDNSPRNLVKSFFGWAKTLMENVRDTVEKVFPR